MVRRGGGSRGGGSRSRSSGGSRSRSRSSSYNRRHYRRGYYGGHYGRGYYRSCYYGDAYVVGPIGTIIITMVFLMVPILIVSGMYGNSSVTSYNLEPGTTMMVDTNREISIDQKLGEITTYIFDNEPALDQRVQRSLSYPAEDLESYGYHTYDLYINAGSDIEIAFIASSNVELYVIKGESNFNSWESGSDTQEVSRFGTNVTFTYSPSGSAEYYFVIESTVGTPNTYTLLFSMDIATHGVAGSLDTLKGDVDSMKLGGKVAIIKNTGSEDAELRLTTHPLFSFTTIFLSLTLFFLALFAMRYPKMRKKHDARISKEKELITQQQSIQPSQSLLTQPAASGYYQRPNPMYCPTCGSAIVLGSKFCTTCGGKL